MDTDQYYDHHDGDFDPNGKIPTGIDSLHDEFNQNTPSDTLSIVQIRAQYAEELHQVEEEIETLKQVLTAKYRRQAFLKQQLGITVMNELRSGINKSMDTLRTTDAFQKTTAVVKSATVKTSAVIHEKWNFLKQTDAFKSFEDKLGSAYSSVRGKLVRSKTLTGAPVDASSSQVQSDEVHWSNDDDVKQENSTSSQSVIADARYDQGDKNGITVSPNDNLQLESLTIEADANDETEEFVQTSRSKSNRKQKQKPKSFAD
ncbi:hypothetical protein P879_06292 [Paragonimus westermani]|uniref:Tumor protein D54 n=1 Tax=Paragonimus westermani TaxID=34504 RepID=A0A8T0DNC7_9TREM|nr:hypothetical protein P879_06292 [Paragonimus westermani]